MRKALFTAIIALGVIITITLGCSKKTDSVNTTTSPSGTSTHSGVSPKALARYSGNGYSQSIPVDTANNMIRSYLTSQGYPGVDNSLRSLSFDADTLRAYLANHKIVTIKLMFAHQPAYINAGGFGQNAGMDPNALTVVIAGVDDSDHYIANSSYGVYEHFSPCPSYCNSDIDAYIHF